MACLQQHPDPELFKAVNGAESDSQTAEGGGGGGGVIQSQQGPL